MIVSNIGSRGRVFTFDDDISVYLITGSRFHILCDTHLGPESMDQVTRYLADSPCTGPVIIFNSHSDWDHIWGNCFFPDSFIIGHELCKTRMLERGHFDLRQNSSLMRGEVRITPPNLIFSDRLILDDEDIEFSHAPGHTIDSAICYDHRDKVLYLGDLVEDPIPYLDAADLDTYITTLRSLLTYQAEMLVSAHSGIVSRDLIEQNIAYIAKVKDGISMDPQRFGAYREVHQWNLNMRILYEFEPWFRDIQGSGYSIVRILELAGDLHTTPSAELKTLLTGYASGLPKILQDQTESLK